MATNIRMRIKQENNFEVLHPETDENSVLVDDGKQTLKEKLSAINEMITGLKPSFYIGEFSPNLQLKGETYEYYNVTSDSTLSLPDVSNIDKPSRFEYHIFLNFNGNYNVKFPSNIKWKSIPKTKNNVLVEYVLTYINFGVSSIWIGDIFNYESEVIEDDEIIKDTDTINGHNVWSGTKEEYDSIEEKDLNTIYFISDGDTTGGSSGGNNSNTINGHNVWSGTLSEYNAIESKDENTIYFISDTITYESLNSNLKSNTINGHTVWSGTKKEYDTIIEKDSNTIYLIKDV